MASSEISPKIFNIGPDSYLLGDGVRATINLESCQGLTPVTILKVDEDDGPFTFSWLYEKYERYSIDDDVWCDAFGRHVFLQKKPGELSLFVSYGKLQTQQDKIFRYQGVPLSEGPYILCLPTEPHIDCESTIHPVYKLYPDPLSAFVCGTIPSSMGSNRYQKTPMKSIPVPSRLYSPPPSEARPLSGRRIAVKDIFDLEGVKTTVCSNAYEALQTESLKTAPTIQKLIDQGAVIIGKVKTTPFSSGMGPRDWVDYQAPFNPRGCGYLDTSCSSSGSGAALAGYEWLDFTIGSDTLGSMVGPAAENGLFGIRPTVDRISCKGVVPISPYLDTPGVFSRDISTLSLITKSWVDAPDSEYSFVMPTKLTILPERHADYVPEIKQTMEDFIQDFEKATKIRRTAGTMEALWALHAPASSSGKSFAETFETTLAHIQLYGHYNHTAVPFRENYKKKFGVEPYIEPLLRYKWNLGAKLTPEQLIAALKEKEMFAKFMNDQIFADRGVMLLPYGVPDVSYRDAYSGSVEEWGAKWQGFDVPVTAFSALGGGPAISIPVGQRLYDSKATGSKEYQPVGLMLLGAPGTDEYLIELVKHVLLASGRPVKVKTGKVAF